MKVFSSIPGNRVDKAFLDEKTKLKKLRSFVFESPDKGVEIPDEFAQSLIKTTPAVFSDKPFVDKAKELAEAKIKAEAEAKIKADLLAKGEEEKKKVEAAKAEAKAKAEAIVIAKAKAKLDAKEEAKNK